MMDRVLTFEDLVAIIEAVTPKPGPRWPLHEENGMSRSFRSLILGFIGFGISAIGIVLHKPYLPIAVPGSDEAVWWDRPDNTWAIVFFYAGVFLIAVAVMRLLSGRKRNSN